MCILSAQYFGDVAGYLEIGESNNSNNADLGNGATGKQEAAICSPPFFAGNAARCCNSRLFLKTPRVISASESNSSEIILPVA